MKDIEKTKNFKISLVSFVTVIFLTVYGLASPIQFYYQMGYSSITYLIIGALLFFIPYSFLVSELSLAFKNKNGGIFSWMNESVGENYSLIGTVMWYGSVITMWFSAASISILISVSLLGFDNTSKWHILFFNPSETVAIIGAIYMIVAGFISTKGLKRMTLLSNISIITLIVVHILLIFGGFLIFALDHFKFAQNFNFKDIHSYFTGPNPMFQTPVAIISFMIYIIFGYGGMENASGLVDKLKNPRSTIIKGVIGSAFLIVILYILIIIVLGSFANWKATFSFANVNLANLQIFITQQEFFKLGTLLHLSTNSSILLGDTINRFINILTLIGLTSVPIRIYTPIKHMFEGMPKKLLPEKIIKLNKNGVPANAVLFQTVIVVFFVLLLGFGGSSVSSLFNKITLMISISASLPVSFIIFAYIKFKMNKNIVKTDEIMSKKTGLIFAFSALITITIVNIVSILQPMLNGNIQTSLWIVAGPIFFSIIALLLIIRKKYIQL